MAGLYLNPTPLPPKVTIIIVSWNGLPLLQQCLPSVMATDYPNFEVVLADNASTDGSAAWTAATYPDVRIIRHPENWGFCRGNNVAIAQTEGPYVLLLNNDVAVPPGWLRPLVDRMEAEPRTAALQPKLLQYDRRTWFEYAGGAGGFMDRLGFPFTRGRLFFTLEPDTGQYNDATDIFWATGAALMLRRTALDEVGLLDERFVLHMEEIDLCWRLLRHGYRVRVAPESEVYHIGGASLPQGSPQKTFYNYRNSLLMLYKNLPPRVGRRVLLERMGFDAVAGLQAVLTGKWGAAGAILRAYRDVWRMRRFYTSTRPSDADPPVLPPYRGRVVLDYYLRRRRYFHQLPGAQFKPVEMQ